jgi:hypothetical protein
MLSPYECVSGMQNRCVQDMENHAGQGPPTDSTSGSRGLHPNVHAHPDEHAQDSTSGSRQRGLHPHVRAQDSYARSNPSPPSPVSGEHAETPRQARFELIDRTLQHRVCGACFVHCWSFMGPSHRPSANVTEVLALVPQSCVVSVFSSISKMVHL